MCLGGVCWSKWAEKGYGVRVSTERLELLDRCPALPRHALLLRSAVLDEQQEYLQVYKREYLQVYKREYLQVDNWEYLQVDNREYLQVYNREYLQVDNWEYLQVDNREYFRYIIGST